MRAMLLVLLRTAATIVVLGILSGIARADTRGQVDAEGPDDVGLTQQVLARVRDSLAQASARVDGSRAQVRVSVGPAEARITVSSNGIENLLPIDRTDRVRGRVAGSVSIRGLPKEPRAVEHRDGRGGRVPITAAEPRDTETARSSAQPAGGSSDASVDRATGGPMTSSTDHPELFGLLHQASLRPDTILRRLPSATRVLVRFSIPVTGPPG